MRSYGHVYNPSFLALFSRNKLPSHAAQFSAPVQRLGASRSNLPGGMNGSETERVLGVILHDGFRSLPLRQGTEAFHLGAVDYARVTCRQRKNLHPAEDVRRRSQFGHAQVNTIAHQQKRLRLITRLKMEMACDMDYRIPLEHVWRMLC
jgi:hypothetical protein